MFHSEAANKSCSAKISVLQKPVMVFHSYGQKPWKICVKKFIFSTAAGLEPVTLLKNELLNT